MSTVAIHSLTAHTAVATLGGGAKGLVKWPVVVGGATYPSPM